MNAAAVRAKAQALVERSSRNRKEARSSLINVIERRQTALEREFATASYDRRAQIAPSLEFYRSVLLGLEQMNREQSPCALPAGATIH